MATPSSLVLAPAFNSSTIYLPLGSGKAKSLGVGNKGSLLDQAAADGLPVPNGYLLLDAAWQLAVHHDYIGVEDGKVVCKNPKAFYEALQFPSFADKTTVAIRSAFSVEDTPNLSMAGHFVSVTKVNPSKAQDVVNALCEVWTSSLSYDKIRRDIIIMQMVDAKTAGVAFSETHYEDDRVNYVEGTAEKLLAGEVGGQEADLPRLRAFEKAEHEEGMKRTFATWKDRLQVILRRVRGLFGNQSWDVEWADDGTNCYLLQVRPVTVPTRRNEIFTLANHKEILPTLPSRYMVSIIESCSGALYEWYRQFDSSLPQQRPFIEVFKGRPYINLSLMTETMRTLGLPTLLVTDNIGGDAGKRAGLNLTRAATKLPALAQLGLAQLRATRSAQETSKAINARAQQPANTFGELSETLRWTYITLVQEMFNLTQAMSLPLVILRRNGKLAEMAAATRSISTKMYDDLLPLREYVAQNPTLKAALSQGELPNDPEFKRRWGLYLATYGHRGIYESDIARPRYHEAPAPLLSALAQEGVIPAPHTTSIEKLDLLAKQARRAILAREQLRHDAMRAFDRIRQQMLKLAEKAVQNGQIPSVDAIWDMTAAELKLIDVGWQPEAGFFEQRHAEIEALAAYDMPDTLRRFDDLDQYNAQLDESITRLNGMSLVAGKVEGKAWVLQEPSQSLPSGYDPATTILVARAVDSGWISTFAKVAAVVVETGGDLSHGSIILRELRLPAITNVKDATRLFKNGDTLAFDGESGNVQKR